MFRKHNADSYELSFFSTPPWCPSCGSRIPRGSTHCPDCGKRLEVLPAERKQIRKHGPQVFSYSHGAFMVPSKNYTIRCRGDQCLITAVGHNGDRVSMSNTVSKHLVVSHIIEPVMALDWEERYDPANYITDGYAWGLDLVFEGREFHSSGYVAKPDDYDEFTRKLERTLCRFLAYGDEGADESATGSKYRNILLGISEDGSDPASGIFRSFK